MRTLCDDFRVFGKNVRNHRLNLGWTTEHCADLCGISRATLIRIEAGKPCTIRTQEHIATVFQMTRDSLWTSSTLSVRGLCVFRRRETRWSFGDAEQGMTWRLNDSGGRLDPDSVQSPMERRRLGSIGIANTFTQRFRAHLPDGFHGCGIVEVYGETGLTFPVNVTSAGVCCLEGAIIVRNEAETYELHAGDVCVFDPSLSLKLAPKAKLGPNDVPPISLYFALQTNRFKRTRTQKRARPNHAR